jgi:hypothetical protein
MFGDYEMKTAFNSKINILQVLTILLGVLSMWGVVPKEFETQMLQTLIIIGPIATIVLRTWFTSLPITWGDEEGKP